MIGLAAAPTTRKSAGRGSRRGLQYVPTSGLAQPMREAAELFPGWRLDETLRADEQATAPVGPPAKVRRGA
jgi:hypothetical protein